MRSYSAEVRKLAALESFNARALLGDAVISQECCDFVLALALAFNDLKDLILGETLLLDQAPDERTVPSRELGAFAGAHFHFIRSILGVLRELLYVVKSSESVRDNAEFKKVVKNLPPNRRAVWQKLVDASHASVSADPDVRFLVIARNTVAYHYEPKAIGRGFRRAFEAGTEVPFLSRGGSIAATRFYFADRAAHSYLQNVFDDRDLETYFLKQPELLKDIAFALFSVVTVFITSRGAAWRRVAV